MPEKLSESTTYRMTSINYSRHFYAVYTNISINLTADDKGNNKSASTFNINETSCDVMMEHSR